MKKVNVNEFKAHGTKKSVVYGFLAYENHVFLPPKSCTHSIFLKQIMNGEKKVSTFCRLSYFLVYSFSVCVPNIGATLPRH